MVEKCDSNLEIMVEKQPLCVVRLIVFDNDECWCKFNDGSSLCLSCDGSSHTVIVPQGECFHRNTRFSTSYSLVRLACMLPIRNLFVCAPVIFFEVLTEEEIVVKSRIVHHARVQWPLSVMDDAVCRTDDGGGCSVKSLMGDATVALESSTKRYFTATFPVRVRRALTIDTDDADDQSMWYTITQCFPVDHFPQYWQYALWLLMGETTDDKRHPNLECSSLVPEVARIDKYTGTQASLEGSLLHDTTSLLLLQSSDTFVPSYVSVWAWWEPSATVWSYPSSNVSNNCEIRIHLHQDNSFMYSHAHNEMFYHHEYNCECRNGDGKGLYAVQAPPLTHTCGNGQLQNINKMIAVADRVRRHNKCVKQSRLDIVSSRPTTPLHFSNDVKEQRYVPSVGEFMAFADGRVRALFVDRTILEMSNDGQKVRLQTPSGQIFVLYGVSHYTQMEEQCQQHIVDAWAFSKWARLSAYERQCELDQQIERNMIVEMMLDQNRRMLKIHQTT